MTEYFADSDLTKTTFSDAALVTAEWWAGHVFGGAIGSSGDGMADMLALVAGAQGAVADIGKRAEFVAALAVRVDSRMDVRFGFTLSVDYGPEPPLADVAREVGISGGSFPWKTMTWTYPTHFVTALGYGGRSVLAWHSPDWERPTCGQGQWGDEGREPWKCSALQYHDGDHTFDTPEPLCQGEYLGRACLKPRNTEAHDLDHDYYGRFAHEFVSDLVIRPGTSTSGEGQ